MRAGVPGQRSGVGAMSITNSVYEGVKHVVVDNLGSGSIIVEPGTGQDLVDLVRRGRRKIHRADADPP